MFLNIRLILSIITNMHYTIQTPIRWESYVDVQKVSLKKIYSLFHAFKSRLQMQSTICCMFCLYVRHTIFLVQNVHSTENRYSTTIHSESGNKTKFSPTGNHCHITITIISVGFEQKLFDKYYVYKIIFTLYSKF